MLATGPEHCRGTRAPQQGGAAQRDALSYHISPGHARRPPVLACATVSSHPRGRSQRAGRRRLRQALGGIASVALVTIPASRPATHKSLNTMAMTITVLSHKFRLTQEIRAAIMLAGLNLPELIEAKHG
jgi:hypothetical protein